MSISPLPFHVSCDRARRRVQVWTQRPIPFETPRDHPWLPHLLDELRRCLHLLALKPGEVLSGSYVTEDEQICDAENRLFTNPSRAIPSTTHLRFERGVGPPPRPPTPLAGGAGHYYDYRVGGRWHHWRRDVTLAQWAWVPHAVPGDGTARPWWVTMRRAAQAGQVQASGLGLDPTAPFGIRLVVHGTAAGPRSAKAVSEQVVDGTIAAFHPIDEPEAVSRALATRLPGVPASELIALTQLGHPIPLFPGPALRVSTAGRLIVSPDDTRCWAGDVELRADARGGVPEVSGELFSLAPRSQ